MLVMAILLDTFLSIREKLGGVAGKKVAIIGDILLILESHLFHFALKKLGAEVMVWWSHYSAVKHIALKLGVQSDVKSTTVV
jgi:aspartate carbamoyltransferase catalytic subunit